MLFEIIKVENIENLEFCASVRKQVFYDEENAPEALYIIDEKDNEASTINILGLMDNIPVATTRFIKVNDAVCKIQRMSVVNKYRKNGYAKELLFFLEKCAKDFGYKTIELDSSLKAVGFYEKYGYTKESDIFYEDNRPHIKLKKTI